MDSNSQLWEWYIDHRAAVCLKIRKKKNQPNNESNLMTQISISEIAH